MPIPTNRTTLLDELTHSYNKLTGYVNSLVPAYRDFVVIFPTWTTKDIIAHLAEWQQMVQDWYKKGKMKEKFGVPADNYNWKQLHELNHDIYLRYKDTTWEDIYELFTSGYKQLTDLVVRLDDKELLTKALYPWMGPKWNLMQWIRPCSSSHYIWAYKTISKVLGKRK